MPSPQQAIIQTHYYPYLLFVPPHCTTQSPCPMIMFLHGSGERGSNLDWVKRHGIARIVEEQPEFPFITVSPQCPKGQDWSVERLSALLTEVMQSQLVDPKRVYLTGLSMGGYGVWRLAAAQPDRFAAIAPVCGGGEPSQALRLKDTPIWVFHGALDDVVPLHQSEAMVEALKACGGNVRFTIYPDAGHDSWTQTYSNPALYDWFLQHQLSCSD